MATATTSVKKAMVIDTNSPPPRISAATACPRFVAGREIPLVAAAVVGVVVAAGAAVVGVGQP